MVCHLMAVSCSSHKNAIFTWQHGCVIFNKLKYNSHAYKKASNTKTSSIFPLKGLGLSSFRLVGKVLLLC